MPWNVLQLCSSESVVAARRILAGVLSDGGKAVNQANDLDWVLDDKPVDENVFVHHYEDGTDNRGYCVLYRQRRPLRMCLGEFVLYRHPLVRFEMNALPVIRAVDEATKSRILADFLDNVAASLRGSEVLSIEGLPVNSLLQSLAKAGASSLRVLQLGLPFMHQSIEFPASYQQYLQQMSSRSRKSVQYSYRKLRKEFAVELFTCQTEEHVERFCTDAIEVSKKTYQWTLLGLGLRDRAALQSTLRKWWRHGGLRSYLLYCDGAPAAFMLGYIFNRCYYYIDVGFDPQWSRYSVGSVLQLDVLEDLYGLDQVPEIFDFSTGYGEHKARFGNHQSEEINVLLLPPTLKNRLVCWLYLALDGLSRSVVGLLDKLGIKRQIKKLIRRWA